jgi:hypothetical protein
LLLCALLASAGLRAQIQAPSLTPSLTPPKVVPADSVAPAVGGGELARVDSMIARAKVCREELAALPKSEHRARALKMFELLRLEDYQGVTRNFEATIATMKAPQLAELWQRTSQIVGTFLGVKNSSVERTPVGELVTIEAMFQHSDLDIKFSFDERHRVIGFGYNQAKAKYSLPSYASPSDADEKELTLQSGEYALPAILSLPKTSDALFGKRFPVALLLHGRGAQDKDRSDGAYKLNKDMALGLARRGVATYRYDKRMRLYQVKDEDVSRYTVNEETVIDAAAAVAELRRLAREYPIDSTRIIIVAPTIAAMTLPRILRADSLAFPRAAPVAGAVTMALNYLKLHELMMPQFEHFFAKDGLTTSELQQKQSIERRVRTVESDSLSLKTTVYDLPYGIPPSYWLDLRSYNHVEAIANLRLPILALFAEQDFDVSFADNALQWKERFADNPMVQWKSYPHLFHFFAEGDGTLRDYDRAGNVSENVIADIAAWIFQR